KFKDVTQECGLPLDGRVHYPTAFVDLDGDGWDDLIHGSRVYRNEPDGKGGRHFVDVTHLTNLSFLPNTSEIVVADFDRDGRLDLYGVRGGTGKVGSWLTGKVGGKGIKGNQLWRNKGNWQFEEVTASSGTDGGDKSCFTAV